MAAKIVLEQFAEIEPSYCWRPAWTSRFESSYSLFSKFALFNVLPAKSIGQLFGAKRNQLAKQSSNINLDLSDADSYALTRIAKLCALSAEQVSEAFVYPLFQREDFVASPYLRFCPACIRSAYHATIFQVDILTSCPIHHTPLQDACPQCGGLILYRLQTPVFAAPYTCPHCNHPLAASLYEDSGRPSILTGDEIAKLEDVQSLLRLKQQIFKCAIDLERHFSFFEHGAIRMSRPQLTRSKNEYMDFLSVVIERWLHPPGFSGSLDSQQVLWLTHSGYATERVRRVGVSRQQDKLVPHPWFERDRKFWEILPIYKAIRRHMWRHILPKHRNCILAAARKMWWCVEGQRQPAICPDAYAFLQWRQFWEGVSVPQHLYLQPTHAPYRLLAWLSDAAPYCPNVWPTTARMWLTHRVFAKDCLRTFHELRENAHRMRARKDAFQWTVELCAGHAPTYWAAAGKGRKEYPLRLCIERIPAPCTPCHTSARRTHQRWHLDQLQRQEP